MYVATYMSTYVTACFGIRSKYIGMAFIYNVAEVRINVQSVRIRRWMAQIPYQHILKLN